MRPATVTVDLAALRHNLAVARARVGARWLWAVVKANAYGHGLVRVARALDAADGFAVAAIDEALELRAAGIVKPILLLEGPFEADEWPLLWRHRLTPVLHCREQLAQLAALPLPREVAPLRLWVKLDTGMHRLGFAPSEAKEVLGRLRAEPLIHPDIGWVTHFACADEPDNETVLAQLSAFEAALGALPGARSLANSAALLAWPQTHGDAVRPGLMLYGLSPFEGSSASQWGLRPVMTFTTRLIAVRTVPPGEAVGYGATWSPRQTTRVGTAAVGYGDGYPRALPSGTPLLVAGRPATLAGRVSMDMIGIDLSHCPEARVGDLVTLWGEGLPVETLARWANTIPYTLTCGITRRVVVSELPLTDPTPQVVHHG